jgi:hypothetical protein
MGVQVQVRDMTSVLWPLSENRIYEYSLQLLHAPVLFADWAYIELINEEVVM